MCLSAGHWISLWASAVSAGGLQKRQRSVRAFVPVHLYAICPSVCGDLFSISTLMDSYTSSKAQLNGNPLVKPALIVLRCW